MPLSRDHFCVVYRIKTSGGQGLVPVAPALFTAVVVALFRFLGAEALSAGLACAHIPAALVAALRLGRLIAGAGRIGAAAAVLVGHVVTSGERTSQRVCRSSQPAQPPIRLRPTIPEKLPGV